MGSASRELLGRILNALEDRELPLLSWGVTGGSLSKFEVREVLQSFTVSDRGAAEIGEDRLLRELLERGLLFAVPDASPLAYRTRLAEGLRLTTSLRQLFVPPEFAGGWWQRYRRLVADYRLHVSDRRYPRRDLQAAEAIESLAQMPNWTAAHAAVARAGWSSYQLSAFQVKAADAVLRALASGRSRAVIVGAGTGSGKTLAFYLPAFSAMASDRREGVVHTLALYPRVELLRDQLKEAVKTALETASAMPGGRPVRIGVLYGRTPQALWALRDPHWRGAWETSRDGLVCPYLACPACETGKMVWSTKHAEAKREILSCADCGKALPEGIIALTRDSLRQDIPKLLFTTTEMLNRNTAGSLLGGVLGWRAGNGPRLVLLDEAHTYSGAAGAQTALLLRRWRFARRRPVTFVGLSATLQQAERFMGQLTCLPGDSVELIEPRPEEMEHEGREYSLVLRGDPVSGVSLLSVSIQTAMLYGRLLDHHSQAPTGTSLFGTTGFAFTDDLDVTNRLYNILREAEGGQYGQGAYPRFKRNGRVLAALRAPEHEQHHKRYRDGQSWDLPVRLGHNLHESLRQAPLIIGRTSSQDTGFDNNANLVVATASLEVGFNDTRVGLVIQHKAPHDPASFLQRRGRAGRERGTRPTTVVVLSDFGRDGLAYRAYDSLFSPEVAARSLPVGNRHVIKIQGAQAFVDWLNTLLGNDGIYRDAREVIGRAGTPKKDDQPVTARLSGWLQQLLAGDGGLLRSLRNHLSAALRLDPAETQALLWEQPRSVMLAVAPSVLRRLQAGSTPVRHDPGASPSSFMPEFVTKTLFASLNVPEVEFRLPFSNKSESLPIAQALREAVPGKVSRRYGYADTRHSTWVPVSPGDSRLDIRSFIEEGVPQDDWDTGIPDIGVVSVVRPYRIRLTQPDPTVGDRSQGFPTWSTQIALDSAKPPTSVDTPQSTAWKDTVTGVGFATHADGNPVEVRRMTLGASGNIVHGYSGQVSPYSVAYEQDGQRVALGFSLTVDALTFEVAPLDVELHRVREHLESPQWRAKSFAQCVAEDPRLTAQANVFQLGWLSLVYLSAFTLHSLKGATPQDAHGALSRGAWGDEVPQIIKLLYRQSQEQQDEEQDGGPVARVVADLQYLSDQPQVCAALDDLATLLFSDHIVERTAILAQRAYRDTFAAAALEAVLRICPDAQDGDLTIDVVPGQTGAPDKVWITETSIGGLGLVETAAGRYAEDPRRFWNLMGAALRPNAFEQTDHRLTRVLRHVIDDEPEGDLAQAMADLRNAKESAKAAKALGDLRRAWSRFDGPPRHSEVAALATRLLRPGSGPQTDRIARALLAEWDRIEQRTGVEVDARVVAYTAGEGLLDVPGNMSADQVFGILWPRGDAARNHHLQVYQPYRDGGSPVVLDRLIAAAVHAEELPKIDVMLSEWVERYQELLAVHGTVDLVCPLADPAVLRDALLRVPLIPVDRGVLRLFGMVERVSRNSNSVLVKVVLKEAEQ
ncbi:protein DpdJ [Streptomyces phytophilus]|uniref:protein DpdJ n=1 Tax=Streptomyces phytophilus TaxID=722715 RepID=UPI0015F03CAC|nr:protein DpdJ [Streptomyces phytophilus]